MKKVTIELEVTENVASKIKNNITNAHLHELLNEDLKLGIRTKIKRKEV